MGWLLKQQDLSTNVVQLYSLGQQRIVLLVGLGNVGRQYEGTRHNIGFACIDAFLAAHEELGGWIEKKSLHCYLAKGHIGDTQVVLIKPTTFMNESGQAVAAVSHFYKIPPENVVVIHDELDVPFGQIRLRVGGSSAGHNGIKSVSQSIDEMYGRIRIGIGPKKPAAIDSADFVLQAFNPKEQDNLANLTQEVKVIIEEFIYGGQLPRDTRSFLI
jgi:PTH1 family peptidyl-tRNA hydrolase